MVEKTPAEQCVLDLTGHIAVLTSALRMIEQGYVYRGAERVEIYAPEMKTIAATALGRER